MQVSIRISTLTQDQDAPNRQDTVGRKRKQRTHIIENEIHILLEGLDTAVKPPFEFALDRAKVHWIFDDLAILRNAKQVWIHRHIEIGNGHLFLHQALKQLFTVQVHVPQFTSRS